MPSAIRVLIDETIESYPGLVRRTSSASATSTGRETITLLSNAYRHAINKIQAAHAGQGLKFLSAVIILTQVEPSFYNYYNVANGFQDKFSIRTDIPDYTNIQGGVGVFGAITLDTLVQTLPINFPY